MIRPDITRSLVALTLSAGLAACGPDAKQEAAPAAAESATPAATVSALVEVKATDYAFTAPPTFPSGWVTLRFDNQGQETHFLLLWRLPEGKTFGDYASQVAQPFGDYYEKYRAGDLSQGEFFEQLGGALPEWFGEIERVGGPGFTAPGRVSRTTVHLEPGEYVMECYVRTRGEDDTFHGDQGMLRPLIVTDTVAEATPPEADVEIVLSNYAIAVSGELTAGEHTVRVRVEEDPEGLILHNVHLARLEEGESAAEVAQWLDWVDHMVSPSPAELLGGAGQSVAGRESYLAVSLEPGRYAWISEDWGRRGMIHEFVVE